MNSSPKEMKPRKSFKALFQFADANDNSRVVFPISRNSVEEAEAHVVILFLGLFLLLLLLRLSSSRSSSSRSCGSSRSSCTTAQRRKFAGTSSNQLLQRLAFAGSNHQLQLLLVSFHSDRGEDFLHILGSNFLFSHGAKQSSSHVTHD